MAHGTSSISFGPGIIISGSVDSPSISVGPGLASYISISNDGSVSVSEAPSRCSSVSSSIMYSRDPHPAELSFSFLGRASTKMPLPCYMCVRCTFVTFFKDRNCRCEECRKAHRSAKLSFGTHSLKRIVTSNAQPIVCMNCVHGIKVPAYEEDSGIAIHSFAERIRREFTNISAQPNGSTKDKLVFDLFTTFQTEEGQLTLDKCDVTRTYVIDKIVWFSHSSPAFIRANLDFFESILRSLRNLDVV